MAGKKRYTYSSPDGPTGDNNGTISLDLDHILGARGGSDGRELEGRRFLHILRDNISTLTEVQVFCLALFGEMSTPSNSPTIYS